MKWTHLPNAGGLYQQDPDLLDKFEYIFRKISEHEQKEREEQERKDKKRSASQPSAPSRGRGKRR